MAYQSLILGILFSIGVFAVKSGMGISYVVARYGKIRIKAGMLLLFALTYFLVFAMAGLFLDRIDPVRHLAAIRTFVQSGMMVHLAMAALLLLWGVTLLKQANHPRSRSKAWLMLVVPCPVCLTVIVFSAGFLVACFPDTPKSVVMALYLVFMLINLVTLGAMGLFRKRGGTHPESLLGGAMLATAGYFFLSVAVMPQFADVDRIYQIARYRGHPPSKGALALTLPFVPTAAAFACGYGAKRKKIRSLQ